MTNEEKAKEITIKLEGEIDTSPHSRQAIEEAILEMAEWKDDKFFMILACIKYSLEKSKIDGVDEFINNIKKEWEK